MTENVAKNYGWVSPDGTCAGPYLLPVVVQILKGLNSKRVLDIGSGNGALCARIAAAGFELVGVEYDAKGCAIARESHGHIPFYNLGVQDSAGELLANEEPFDTVISTEVIEHLFSPHLLPRFAHACLKEGGYLVVSTPYHGYLKNLALSIADGWDKHLTALQHGGHIKFWSKKTLTQLLAANGFEVVAFHGAGRLPYLWKSMLLVAKRVPLPGDSRADSHVR